MKEMGGSSSLSRCGPWIHASESRVAAGEDAFKLQIPKFPPQTQRVSIFDNWTQEATFL